MGSQTLVTDAQRVVLTSGDNKGRSSENCELNGIDFIIGTPPSTSSTEEKRTHLKDRQDGHYSPVAVTAQTEGMHRRVAPNGHLSGALVQGTPLQAIWSRTTHRLATDIRVADN